MAYSIFAGTMADMTYEEVELAAKRKASVLLPVGVIEGHGPHMCLGVDTYLTYALCQKVLNNLKEKGRSTLIAPPFYWGINRANDAFAGSFTVKRSTMSALLLDIMACIRQWGLGPIFLVNIHGDIHHNRALLDAVKDAYCRHKIEAGLLLPDFLSPACKISGSENYILVYKMQEFEAIDGYADIHAGAMETAWMLNNFPELVDIDMIPSLPSSQTSASELTIWAKGGMPAKRVLPKAYCGDPASYDRVKAQVFEKTLVEEISRAIISYLDKNAVK